MKMMINITIFNEFELNADMYLKKNILNISSYFFIFMFYIFVTNKSKKYLNRVKITDNNFQNI